MRELENVIECYRGEAFDITRSFTNKDGVPLYIPKGTVNPYLKVSVHSNTYIINGEYRKNYWLDLSSMAQYKGYRQFDSNEVPATGIAVDNVSNPDGLSIVFNDGVISSRSIVNDAEIGNSVNLVIVPRGAMITTGSIIGIKIPGAIRGIVSLKVYCDNMNTCCLTTSAFQPSTEQFGYLKNNEVTLNVDTDVDAVYFWFTNLSSTDQLTIRIGNLEYVDNFDRNYIGYIITDSGREYYVWNETEYVQYSFSITKTFLNHDTKDWISGIYKYDMTICSGQLMFDWLTRNFESLYPGVTPPESNEELARYICKSGDSGLLRNVDITEPLVSYNINTVLLGPTKLIVKEA